MDKTLSFIATITCIFILLANNAVMADAVSWTNGAGNRIWSDTGNWNLGRLPYYDPNTGHQDDAIIVQTGSNAPVFSDSDGSQSAWFIPVGQGSGVSGELWIQGGSLWAPWGMAFNKNGNTASNSTVHMSGGILNLTGSSGILEIGRRGYATFNITGGSVMCVSLEIPDVSGSGYGTLNLDGGSVSADSVSLAGPSGPKTGVINITQGTLLLNGNKVGQINGFVSSGAIRPYYGYTGRGVVNVDYDIRNAGKTTVTAARTELNQAWNPQPMDGHPAVDKPVVLSWTPGDGAVSHKLYLGDDFNDVNEGIVEFIIPESNSYAPEAVISDQTYYWRVDEVNGPTTVQGVVWSFTVDGNPVASEPRPGDGARGIDPNADIFWRGGDRAIAHDVYFGTSFTDVNSASDPNVPPGKGRQDANSYDPGTLVLGQTYYWRIDEFDGNNIYGGAVWSFDVISSFATEPKPLDGSRYIAPDVVLNWTPGYRATSHDVYIGTNSADVNSATIPVATTTVTSYDPENISRGQTYYWRIDEFDGTTEHKGVIWSFTTEPAGVIRAFPGAEGYGAYSIGGRGGDVYHVTNLTDDANSPQPGSLRYGINTATGPRTIVFDISGYIELQNRLEITKPYITIAGQTAPGDGITLRKHDMRVYNTHNIIIRFIRVRVGKYSSGQDESQYGGLDALSIEAGTDIIVDHVSTSWGVDELMSITGDSNDITVQWCALTEPLNYYEHSKASLLRPAMTSRLTHHHNLYADIMKRVTRFGNYNDDVVTRFDWYNNVVFNWGSESTYSNNNTYLWDDANRVNDGYGVDGEFPEINFLDNYFMAGPTTTWFKAYQGGSTDNHKIWASGNLVDFDLDTNFNGVDTGWDMIGGYYMKMPGAYSIESPYTWESSQSALQRVLAQAGASYVRDAVDERIVSQVKACIGSVPNTQDDVGGFPTLAEVNRPADWDTDGDGMPDVWETARSLNPNNAVDGATDSDSDGYTNLEEYLNFLAFRGGELLGDFDKDGDVDLDDLSAISSHWLENNCDNVPVGNLDFDCDVDFVDYAIFGSNWGS